MMQPPACVTTWASGSPSRRKATKCWWRIVSAEPDVCGGIVLRPVRTAVLHDQHCPLTEFEAEGFAGRRYRLPGEVMQRAGCRGQYRSRRSSTQHYLLLLDFADDRLIYQYSETILERAALYSRTSHARVTIRAYAATRPLKVSGHVLSESLELARARAKMVDEALLRLGVDRSALHVEWRMASRRRSIRCRPSVRRSPNRAGGALKLRSNRSRTFDYNRALRQVRSAARTLKPVKESTANHA